MRIWLTNHPRSKIDSFKKMSVWEDIEVGQPQGTKTYSSKELEDMNYVGLYKISDRVKGVSEWQSVNRGLSMLERCNRLARVLLTGQIGTPSKALTVQLGRDIDTFADRWIKGYKERQKGTMTK